MMNISKIESGEITQVIVADSTQWAEQNLGGTWIELPDGAGIGWTWDGSTATPPTQPAPAPRLRLTKREFRKQFTFAEKQAIYTAAETSVDVRIFLDDLMAAEHIDCDNADTVASVNALETNGLIATGRADEILAGVTD